MDGSNPDLALVVFLAISPHPALTFSSPLNPDPPTTDPRTTADPPLPPLPGQEFLSLQKSPLDYCTFELVDDDILEWRAHLSGPAGTPYSAGTFALSLAFPPTYPFKPPEVAFLTPVYHPNVKTGTGEICSDLLGGDGWGPTLNVRHVMGTIRDALERPSGDSPLEPDIALQLSERPREFERRAAKFTREHATGGK